MRAPKAHALVSGDSGLLRLSGMCAGFLMFALWLQGQRQMLQVIVNVTTLARISKISYPGEEQAAASTTALPFDLAPSAARNIENREALFSYPLQEVLERCPGLAFQISGCSVCGYLVQL